MAITHPITGNIFLQSASDYEKDLKELEERIPTLREKAKAEKRQDKNVSQWVSSISKYLKVQHLDRYMARELIDTITVSKFYKVDGKNVQDVVINYKFVGNLQKLLSKEKNAA